MKNLLSSPLQSVVVLLLVVFGVTAFSQNAAAQSSYVEGISAILSSTNGSEVDTWSETFLTPDIAYYYGAYVQGFLFQNGAQIASAYADRYPYGNDAYFGLSRPVVVGDIYQIESDHYIVEYYIYGYDYYGYPQYYNPDYFLVSNGGGSPDPSGWNFTPGGGPIYYDVEYLYLGTTAVQISSAAPHISGINPTGGSLGTSGSITVNGTDLIDVFTGESSAQISGSGVTVSVQSQSSSQVVLNYTVDSGASTGGHNLTLSTRFGTSNGVTFNVGDPTPNITSVSPNVWNAGATTSFTITGRGFGTNPTLELTGTGVTGSSISTASDTQIQASVTIDASAPSGSATIKVTSNGYGGSGFISTNPGQSNNNTANANIESIPAPVPEIHLEADTQHQGDCTAGTNIAGNSTTVLAGQQIVLAGCVPNLPAGVSVNTQSQTWSVQNQVDITGGYCAPNAFQKCGTAGEELADPTMSGVNGLTFYWVNPGTTEAVTFQYTLSNGKTASATASFTINGPTGVSVSNYAAAGGFSPVAVYFDTLTSPGAGQLGLGYGGMNTSQYGIVLQVAPLNVTSGQSGTGANSTYTWVQLLTNNKIRLRGETSNTNCASGQTCTCYPKGGLPATAELDDTYPYSNTNSADPNPFNDAPATPLYDSEVAQVFAARTYLMWDPALPSGCHPANTDRAGISTPSDCSRSIPIPLGSINWNWSGNVLRLGITQPAPNNTDYKLCCGPESEGTFSSGGGYPQWQAIAAKVPISQYSCTQP